MTEAQRHIGSELCERLSRIGDSLTLTDEEREAIERAADWLCRWQEAHGYHSEQDGDLTTLRGLLERTR